MSRFFDTVIVGFAVWAAGIFLSTMGGLAQALVCDSMTGRVPPPWETLGGLIAMCLLAFGAPTLTLAVLVLVLMWASGRPWGAS